MLEQLAPMFGKRRAVDGRRYFLVEALEVQGYIWHPYKSGSFDGSGSLACGYWNETASWLSYHAAEGQR